MITPGTILIEEGTVLPESLRLENEFYPSTWRSVKNRFDPHELENQLTSAGWTFFYMAGQLSTVSFGLDRKKMIHAALKRIITKTRLQKCNCLEIDEVATHSFLGVPYVNVTAHPRHIQKGFVFSGTDMRYGNALPRAAELRPLSEEPFLMKEALERWEAEGGTGSRLEWRSTAQLALDPFLFPRET